MTTSTLKKPKKPPVCESCPLEDIVKEQKVQKVLIAKINRLLVGNHDIENGVVYKLLDVVKDVNSIKDDISEIKGTIKDAINSSTKTAKALELYKVEMEGVGRGLNSAEEEKQKEEERKNIADTLKQQRRRDNWYKALTIIGLICAIYFGFQNSRQSEKINSGQKPANEIPASPITDTLKTK